MIDYRITPGSDIGTAMEVIRACKQHEQDGDDFRPARNLDRLLVWAWCVLPGAYERRKKGFWIDAECLMELALSIPHEELRLAVSGVHDSELVTAFRAVVDTPAERRS